MELRIKDIAELVSGEVIGDENLIIRASNGIENAQEGDLTFLADMKYEQYLYSTKASAVLVPRKFKPKQDNHPVLIKVRFIRSKLVKLQKHFLGDVEKITGVMPNASVASDVFVPDSCYIGNFAVVKSGVVLGEGARIEDQVFVAENCKIGSNSVLHPGVKVYAKTEIGENCTIQSNAVLGSDGFGYVPDENGVYHKMHHTGNVVLEDEVDIGANTVIDRAVLGTTVIKKGAKLDNLIQIAHNVTVGENTVIAAQTGVAGSTEIGNQCIIGGQVGIVGHIKIENGVKIQAQSGINKKLETGKSYYGSPAMLYMDFLRSYQLFRKLPELESRLSKIEKLQ